VCSPCCDKLLQPTGKCHVCGVSATGGYSRCHAMERLVESIHVQCPNAAHGCTAKPAYYDQHSHCQTCPHAPCHCPGEACSFIGSTAALLDHIAGVHGWPCTKTKAGERDTIRLRDGFNFLLAVGDAGDDGSQGTTTNHQWLFLLNVARQRLDRIISVLCFYPRVNAEDARLMEFSLTYSNYSQVFIDRHGGCLLSNHYHSSSFRVACSNLSNGLPNPDECFRFVVPNSVVGDPNKEDGIEVKASTIIK
jgi:E3 ubiquitin-protein ligase SIAH1